MAKKGRAGAPGFPGDGHDHQGCIDQALDKAAEHCRRLGLRLTPLRRKVLELVWGGHRPMGAYEILDSLRQERQGAAPPTVYRALDFLLAQGMVHRIEHLNAFVGCTGPDHPHAGQFLICRSCGLAAEINDSRIEDAIQNSAMEAGFSVSRRTIEVEGVCPNCARESGEEANG